MRVKDIPQFIQDGDYEVAIHLGYLEKAIADYEENYQLDLNPDFQRGHVWSEAQQIAFVEFFLKGGKTANVIYFNCPYFPGVKEGETMDMVCVDGLQRLTALRRFLNNEIKVFGHYLNEFEDSSLLGRKYYLKFNVNNLQTREDVLQWYLDFNTGGTVHSESEIERVKQLLAECRQTSTEG